MKQDLQNLREEIKQLGREIRTQLKGEHLGRQRDTSLYPPRVNGEYLAQRGK